MGQLEEGFRWIPGLEGYYSINIDGKIASYLKFHGSKKGWIPGEHPVSFIKWQRGGGKGSLNYLFVHLHKDGKPVKVSIGPTIKRVFGIKRFMYRRCI